MKEVVLLVDVGEVVNDKVMVIDCVRPLLFP